jgi:glycosyltransferase involved in cell wall biosynthesis
MRVLYVCQNMVIPINQETLASLADQNGVDVGLLVPSEWRDLQFDTSWTFQNQDERITAYPSPIRMSGRVGAYTYRKRDIQSAIQEFKPDLLQVGQESFSLSAWQMARAAKKHGIPMCLYAWESIDRPLSFIRRKSRRTVLERTSVLMTAGQPAGELHRSWGYSGRIDVFPQLGIDPERFSPAPFVQGSPLRIGFIGRLIPRKGVDLILEAAANLHREGMSCTVTLVGSGPEEAALRSQAQALGVPVDWKGFQPHDAIPELLRDMDVLAVPSRSEPDWAEQFGHVLIEAMSMQVPPIGSTCGEIPVVIGAEDQVFQENDLNAFTAILRRAAEDAGWRRERGEAGRQRVLDHYAHGQISRKYVAAWEYALNQLST